MNCYGKWFGRLEECRNCTLRRHCRQAADPPLYADSAPPPELAEKLIHARRPPGTNRLAGAERDRRYSRADLLEVITFMAALDIKSLELISRKLELPDLNLSDLAARRGVSRQAMHKMVTRRLERIPELAAVLTYRKKSQQPKPDQKSFMEEVCLIRTRTRANRSKRPKLTSNCLRKLRYSTPSLNLSKMSILKGAFIWRSESMN